LGGLLALLSDVLYVSPLERTSRAIKKIYGEEKEYSVVLDVDAQTPSEPIEYSFGRIDKIFEIGDTSTDNYDILFQTTGYQGYKNGTITVWVKVVLINGIYSIDKVVLESYEKQTLMSKLDCAYYDNFKLTDVTDAYRNGENFTTDANAVNGNPVSGATYSATAGNNAVNCVITYLGGQN
jgi:hypothetical protein